MTRVRLTPAQKDEIRKLTQFANRRIRAAQKAYEQEGKMILPRELAGDVQMRDDWMTSNTPLSRSVVFESQDAYRQRIQFLRRFRANAPTVQEYTTTQSEHTKQAMETSLGRELSPTFKAKLEGMSAPQLSEFWKEFSRQASRLGLSYSSDQAMRTAISEFFGEDYERLTG